MKRVTLYRVTVKPCIVEVPDACPHCEEPTVQVVEVNYNDAHIMGSYGSEPGTDGTIPLEDVQENEAGDVFYPIEVRCWACEKTMVDAWRDKETS